MEEQHTADDQSHYEISLTAGQAFIAFVLLLLSLAASFAFGLMIGKGQADERLVVRKEAPPAVTEASVLPKKSSDGHIVELGVGDDDFRAPATSSTDTSNTDANAATDSSATAAVIEEPSATTTAAPAPSTNTPPATTPASTTPATTPASPTPAPAAATPSSASTPVFAQLLSTSDQKTAEALAARLINRGFTSAYVVRGATDKGSVFRVRVRFGSDAEARAAETKLHEFSSDVWITTK
ncbi:MAG: SPOR domain-containing protein [Acidobacteria bacterium]|nr:SPOR domain-containing protein [Acidobacteriota bacterium]MBV9476157.1 SPOR domain-containing protein [Acidobacteriota bacterium]